MSIQEEVRTVATLLTAATNGMCNVGCPEEVTSKFVEAKDLLIKLFELNIKRTSN